MFHEHGTNAIYVLIDIFITATPLVLLHFLHSVFYAALYILVSVIYTLAGGTNYANKPYIYSVLDWNSNPGVAAAYSVPLVIVGVPMIWLILYGLYRLRVLMAVKCCTKSNVLQEKSFDAEQRMTPL